MQQLSAMQMQQQVALLAEGVDRNKVSFGGNIAVPTVALLAEGVDRNFGVQQGEMLGCKVALLAEGVDRNNDGVHKAGDGDMSPSSRRAWIEIVSTRTPDSSCSVALLAEGVDRNMFALGLPVPLLCRPPRGGRG